MLALAQREQQCLKKFSGAGFDGPGKVTKARKSQAWDEVAAEIARLVFAAPAL
jgi:hypothetical protein